MKIIIIGTHEILISDKDIDMLQKYRFYIRTNDGNILYAITSDRSKIFLHHIIMERMINRKINSKEQIDHMNHNTLDNRRSNLRLCNNSKNSMNRNKINCKTSSEYKGVYFSKRDKTWYAYIKLNGKKKHLGCYSDEIEAATSYDQAARKYFGEFAALNFLIENEQSCLK